MCHCVFFLPLLSRNVDDQLSSNFHRFVILCRCWDTLSGNTGFWHNKNLLWKRLQEWSLSRIWKHKTLQRERFFLSLFSCNFDDKFSPNFHKFVIVCIWCLDSPRDDVGLWQLPNGPSSRFHETLGLILTRVRTSNWS